MNPPRSVWHIIVSAGLLLFCSCATAPPDLAIVSTPELPEEVPMSKGARQGIPLFLKVRLDTGEEFEWMMDTGSPKSDLPRSLEPALGKRLGIERYRVPLVSRKVLTAHIYAAPRIYLGDVPLITGSRIGTVEDTPVIGMDILRHYCIQLDFEAGMVRFLDPGQLNVAELGKAYPLLPSQYAMIRGSGLFGEQNSEVLIDTGSQFDAHLAPGVFDRFVQTHGARRLPIWGSELIEGRVPEFMLIPEFVWDGKTYTDLIIEKGSRGIPNLVGLRFLARHLVTFDFPNGKMYLNSYSCSLLSRDGALEFLGTEPASAANESQPIRAETNPTSSAAGSRR